MTVYRKPLEKKNKIVLKIVATDVFFNQNLNLPYRNQKVVV